MTDKPRAIPRGALQSDWDHFDLVLGLGADLLPVVPDENATPTANSMVKRFGKIPSTYDGEGNARGIKDWQKREITPGDIERWSADRRLSMCVRAAAVKAIDVDIPDIQLSHAVRLEIESFLHDFPLRVRKNSAKFLVAFTVKGEWRKRIINCGEAGRIEFLADGQQWIAAGSHPSGVLYDWGGRLPDEIPELTAEQFEELWSELQARFAVEPSAAPRGEPTEYTGDAAGVLTSIDGETLDDLHDALRFEPLLRAAADNDVWARVGMALLSLGVRGEALWLEFSRNASGYEPGAPETWWAAHIV